MSEKPVYKEKMCHECNKSFKINYFYSHRKCKRHLKNVASIKLKDELLIGDNTNQTATDDSNSAKKLLASIKDLITKYESEQIL
jgi:hypothetical protein